MLWKMFCKEKWVSNLKSNTKTDDIMIFDRKTGKVQKETVFGDKALRFVYNTLLGRSLWGILFNSSRFSDLMGAYYDSPRSKKNIAKLAALEGCNSSEAEFPPEEYASFNAFFTRHLKKGARPFDPSPEILSSPADGRVFVYENMKKNDPVPVKGAQKTLEELCCGKLSFSSCAVAVFRLAPVDYHRFHFPCACTQDAPTYVFAGKYHSVNPVALLKRPDLYVENTRHITQLSSNTFGKFLYLEVGAFGVGSIIQTAEGNMYAKQAEKGYFKFGGSTVILIFDNDRMQWDADLLENTRNGYETLIRCGENIGRIKFSS